MSDVFISYKQEERERMRPIANALIELGLDVWFDARLEAGASFSEEIQREIDNCLAQIVCWSPAAIASEWVRGEAEIGRKRGVLVPVMIEPCRLPPPFNMIHAENLIGWDGRPENAAWRGVLRVLSRHVGRDLAGAELWTLQGGSRPTSPQPAPANTSAARNARPKRSHMWLDDVRDYVGRGLQYWLRSLFPPERVVATIIGTAVIVGLIFVFELWPRASTQLAGSNTRASSGSNQPAQSQLSALGRTPRDPAVSALQALDQISRREWLVTSSRDLLQRALAASSRTSLEAAAQTDARAEELIGVGYYEGVGGYPQDYVSAARFYRMAADRGNPRAQAGLGVMYLQGESFQRDAAEAVRLFRLSASQGDPTGQANLGVTYYQGQGGITQDYTKAARLFRLAANQGSGIGQVNLGVLYYNGLGVTRDQNEAIRLFRLAANQGNADAQDHLRQLGQNW